MFKTFLNKPKKIYFIGIGGIGVSSLANILIKLGHNIYGSDITENTNTLNLREAGALINIGHSSENIFPDLDMVVVSTAISKKNPEIQKANFFNIPIIHRSEMLSLMIESNKVIAVAGSHGKTTTTSLVSSIIEEANLDPTIFIGGVWGNIQGNYKLGQGEFAVIEADESDGSLLNYNPQIAIITNLEYEHVDYYKSLEDLKETFFKFIDNVSENGLVILCEDDVNCRDLKNKINKKRRVLTYGINTFGDVIANNIYYSNGKTIFTVLIKQSDGLYKNIGEFTIKKIGQHNVSNTLAAICVGIELGIDIDILKTGLANCEGVERRMQYVGEGTLKLENKSFKDIILIQDYGHHPTEILSTTTSIKKAYGKRIVTIFQPHRFSRTKMFLTDFCQVLSKSDYLLITDIYPGSEEPIEGFSVNNLTQQLKDIEFNKYKYFNNYTEMVKRLSTVLEDEDIILFLGAGDIYNLCDRLKRDFLSN